MMRNGALGCVAFGLLACAGDDDLRFEGDDMAKYFPFEGNRTWTYKADDNTTPYLLIGRSAEESELTADGNTRVYTVNFTYQCFGAAEPCLEDLDEDNVPDLTGAAAFSWSMSANSSSGVNVHAFDGTTYDPPVRLADRQMSINESVETVSGGTTYTSTYEAQGACPAPYWRGSPPEDCVQLVLDDGGAGSAIAGEFWAIFQFNIVAFTRTADGVAWQLNDYDDEL